MSDGLLVSFNFGSSTAKVGLFEVADGKPRGLANGAIDFRKTPLRFQMKDGPAAFDVALAASAPDDCIAIVRQCFEQLTRHFDTSAIRAVGHRIVHGGDVFKDAVLIDDRTIEEIAGLAVLAPLHQSQALQFIRAIRALRPALPQAACFDTSFHRDQADVVRRFAIPRAMHDRGIKRYGFHGLSYQYIAGELARRAPELAKRKVVVAHLGSGASLCGMENGSSRDTSMGFSALDGVPMATRCGALDPGVTLHLIGEGMGAKEIEALLYHRSGLLGMSGISADTRDLMRSPAEEAKQAIDIFNFRIAGEVARLASTLGGIDALVFTAGVGENQPEIRAAICSRLAWLGVELDGKANTANAYAIHGPQSRVAVFVIRTDEQQVIAEKTLELLKKS